MAQVFADGEQLQDTGMRAVPAETRPVWMVRPRGPVTEFPPDQFGPALTAGKGTRLVRCVGCSDDTLPRPDDNAPLCARCSDLLAESSARPAVVGRWRWRRLG
ncbi:hypothetical protein ACIB24_03555 [Spongisporangium articulatum]|uniref:Uncharacterized protein n=1 Tax=Spongisporangium articulatum TaxID=3362603 RepID=A0ABW8AIE3_9ACTN